MEFIACLGQILFGLCFLVSAFFDLQDYRPLLGLMTKKNIFYPKVLLPLALMLKVFGGIALILDSFTVLAALALALFILIANIIFHPFWKLSGLDFKKELTQFLAYTMAISGLLILAGFATR